VSLDLRTERPGGTWTRRFGDHEQQGFEVSVNSTSAHVTLTAHGILFAIDRRDIPAAWDKPIDVVKLRAELIAAIVRHMSVEILEDLFREIHSQRQTAFRNGQHATRTKIKEALGL
jgi:hypothetical protein